MQISLLFSTNLQNISLLKRIFIWQPYKTCAAFLSQQEDLREPDSELKKFQDSKVFKKSIKEISKRLGFDEKLKKRDIMNMFDMCRYEQAWNTSTHSIWCAVSVIECFNIERMIVLCNKA